MVMPEHPCPWFPCRSMGTRIGRLDFRRVGGPADRLYLLPAQTIDLNFS
jgi:hypothetical protein